MMMPDRRYPTQMQTAIDLEFNLTNAIRTRPTQSLTPAHWAAKISFGQTFPILGIRIPAYTHTHVVPIVDMKPHAKKISSIRSVVMPQFINMTTSFLRGKLSLFRVDAVPQLPCGTHGLYKAPQQKK